MQHLSADELSRYLAQQGDAVLLLDVREPWEYALCHIEGSTHVPMHQIARRLDDLDPEQEIVVICHHGVRSLQVALLLEHSGFKNVINLNGGIDAWARTVDTTLALY